MKGKPPYTITEKAADALAKIVETVTRLEYGTNFKRNISLHRENRLRTIHSSLAIEGNSLSLGEVTAVIEGRLIAGRQEEVKEVKNAYEAYDRMMALNPYAISDFLKGHKLMTQGLIKESGKFRSGDVGVFDGDVAVHIGARPQFVRPLMEELFVWAETSELHPVIKSAILHYEIETIHPFADGNGRMGRLWQILLLAKWNPLFAWIPMEAVLYRNRPQYYQAIQDARDANDSGVFIEFTLSALLQMIAQQLIDEESRPTRVQEEKQEKHQDEHQDEHQDKHQDKRQDAQQEDRESRHETTRKDMSQDELGIVGLSILRAIGAKAMTRKEIFSAIGVYDDSRAFKRHIQPLIDQGLVERTLPDKPNSKHQRYRLSDKGMSMIP